MSASTNCSWIERLVLQMQWTACSNVSARRLTGRTRPDLRQQPDCLRSLRSLHHRRVDHEALSVRRQVFRSVSYRCTKSAKADHPRPRLTEAVLDRQMLELFDRIRIQDENVREWLFVGPCFAHRPAMLRPRLMPCEENCNANWRLPKVSRTGSSTCDCWTSENFPPMPCSINTGTEADRIPRSRSLIEVANGSRGPLARSSFQQPEIADLAVRVFELSQTLKEKWLAADCTAKRQNPRNRLLELPARWHNSRLPNEEALRRTRRSASSFHQVEATEPQLNFFWPPSPSGTTMLSGWFRRSDKVSRSHCLPTSFGDGKIFTGPFLNVLATRKPTVGFTLVGTLPSR